MTTPFVSYAFLATGASTTRTLPARLADVTNVRDFGAVGDGVTDDLAAITAAYNWTANANRGTLYFPPGTYNVSRPIDISDTDATHHTYICLLGQMGLSTITGNFADYIIKRYLLGSNAVSGGHIIEKLTIINQHASGGGIRLGVSVGAAIRDCDITANRGITTDNSDTYGPPGDPGAYWYSLETCIENCQLRAYSALASGSIGLARGANGPTTNCTFNDFDKAFITYGGQGLIPIQGCYFEHNNIGLANGIGPDPLFPSPATAVQVSGCRFKNNGIAISGSSSLGRFGGILIEATEGAIAGNPQHGVYFTTGGKCAFDGVRITGQYQVAGFQLDGGESTRSLAALAGVSITNTSTLGGAAWSLPSTAMSIDLDGCNVAPVWTMAKLPAHTLSIVSASWSGGTATIVITPAPDLPAGQSGNVSITGVSRAGYNGTFAGVSAIAFNTFTYTVADPGGSGSGGTVFFTPVSDVSTPNAFEGDCYNVSNADTATWGAAALSGGSNHAKVRYTSGGWTVMGK